jgi:hypothetical protein
MECKIPNVTKKPGFIKKLIMVIMQAQNIIFERRKKNFLYRIPLECAKYRLIPTRIKNEPAIDI